MPRLDWDDWLDQWRDDDPNAYYQEMDRLLEVEDERERSLPDTPIYYALTEHYQWDPVPS